MSREVENCSICQEKYTKTERKQIICPFCDYSACACCLKRWLISNDNNYTNPGCTNCSVVFTRKLLCDFFGKYWVSNQYDNYRIQFILDSHLSKLHEMHKFIKYREEIEEWFFYCSETIQMFFDESDHI